MEYPAWKIKLKEKLTKQFEIPELEQCIKQFVEELALKKPELLNNPFDLAEFLVDGDFDKHQQVFLFMNVLSKIQNAVEDPYFLEKISDTFALLLQTLVLKNDDAQKNGFTLLPVEETYSVETIGSSRNVIPHLPKREEIEEEHINGRRNHNFKVAGVFFPEEGGLNCESICETIAKELLGIALGMKNIEKHPLGKLSGLLDAYSKDDQPLQVVYFKPQKTSEMQSMSEAIDYLHNYLEGKIWFYIFGDNTDSEGKSEDWLHTSEVALWGLLSRFNEEQKRIDSFQQRGNHMTKKGITVIGNVGEINEEKTVQGNNYTTQINHDEHSEFKQTLKQTLKVAEQSDDVGKAQFIALSQALDIIEKQIDNSQAVDKKALEESKDTLSGLVDLTSIGSNISTILSFLNPIFGL